MSWEIVRLFKVLENPSPSEVIQLESAFNDILIRLESNRCHVEAGYSESFPRYRCTVSTDDNHKKITKRLRKHYWARQKQLQALDRQIKDREVQIQATCEHVWEKDWECRDHRSHYDCKKCGKYR